MTDRPSPVPATDLTLDLLVEDPAWDHVAGAAAAAERAARAALAAAPSRLGPLELSLVLASDDAVRTLNRDYRGQDRPTNVLSFPAVDHPLQPPPSDGPPILLGDVILARDTVLREAAEQRKAPLDHLAHLVVHGVLHLLGHDHEDATEAADMEALETRLLADLGIADPYQVDVPEGAAR